MNKTLERRNLTHEFRVSDDATPKISGYASIFSSPYDVGFWIEEVDPNAFDGVIASNPDVRALWNHNSDFPLGRTSANTLSLNVDSRGLAYEIDPPATSYANDLIVSMRRKDVTQSSFAFVVKRDQWTENADGSVSRMILEFDELLDVSPVTYPANPAANSGVRSLPGTMPTELRTLLENRAAACLCSCAQCVAGACGICSSDPQCAFAIRSKSVTNNERRRMEMQIVLLSLSK